MTLQDQFPFTTKPCSQFANVCSMFAVVSELKILFSKIHQNTAYQNTGDPNSYQVTTVLRTLRQTNKQT